MVRVKICGMRRLEDIEMANRHKPDYIGFVFAESPRKVSYEQAKQLSNILSEDIVPVGVFVDEHMKLIVDLFKDGIIEIAQLHGDEDEKYIRDLKDKSIEETGREIPIINAIEIKDNGDKGTGDKGTCNNGAADKGTGDKGIGNNGAAENDDENDADFNDKLLEWRDSASDYFILDSGKGSGKTFDWSLIDKDSEFFRNSIFLAGGLSSENLLSAIEEFNPFAVDLSSSVETDGFKDEKKIKEIIEIIEDYR